MTTYSKYNIVYRLQKWMDSVPGQTFLNYAYSWGASVVILGTLFKLTHLPGANFFLFLGMGTEVFVFFISAFDRPFDKTTDGMNLDNHMKTEEELEAASASATVIGGNGGTIIIGGSGGSGGDGQARALGLLRPQHPLPPPSILRRSQPYRSLWPPCLVSLVCQGLRHSLACLR